MIPCAAGVCFGTWPGLELEQRFERGDLAVTTEFRRVLSERRFI